MAATVMELYGSKVFNEHEMRERLPSSTYKSLKATIEKGQPLDLEVANVVASVMKRWAIEQGATHYTHWFQPMTGVTAEKHDSFISPCGSTIEPFNMCQSPLCSSEVGLAYFHPVIQSSCHPVAIAHRPSG